MKKEENFNFLDKSSVGKTYKDFYVVSVDDIPDYEMKGVYLRHKKTGLEVYHLVDDDKENYFSFAFRTTAKNSKGAAHIIEHSVLCGSEKYKLKEPFNTLYSQSVLTFANAFTFPEKTMYPGSSVIKSDFMNMFDVYADAVFFPTLSKQTFQQEGWRLEYDENDKPSIQGVVYNEMKGAFSDFNEEKIMGLEGSMFNDSYINYVYGGDPEYITSLTYEDFLDFHKKFYSPSNCLLVIHGNIPTAEHLDHINKTLTPRLIEKYGTVKLNKKAFPVIRPEVAENMGLNEITESREVKSFGPNNGVSGSSVNMSWSTSGLDHFAISIMESVLLKDGGLLAKAIEDQKYGNTDICGLLDVDLNKSFITFGINSVKDEDIEKAKEHILKCIKELDYDKAFDESRVEAQMMKMEMGCRELNRPMGAPYALNMAEDITNNWLLADRDLSWHVNTITDFMEFKKTASKEFFIDLYKKVFLSNKPVVSFICTPSDEYTKNKDKAEAEIIKKLVESTDKEQVKKDLKALHEYQTKVETEEELSCIPTLKVSDLTTDALFTPEVLMMPSGQNAANVPIFVHKENTHGITYVSVYYPADNIRAKDNLALPMIESIDKFGTKKLNWSDALAERAKYTTGVYTDIINNPDVKDERALKSLKYFYDTEHIKNRRWLKVSSKFFSYGIESGLSTVASFINDVRMNDQERFDSLFNRELDSLKESAAQDNSENRCGLDKSSHAMIDELWTGITQLKYMESVKASKNGTKKLRKRVSKLWKEITRQGGYIYVTTDLYTPDVLVSLTNFAKSISLELPKKCKSKDENLKEYIYYPDNYDNNLPEVIKADVLAGYASTRFDGATMSDKYYAAECILFKYLSTHQLWEQIRTKNGAYGAYINGQGASGLVTVSSYRDPNPSWSVKAFEGILKEATEIEFSKADIDKCIISYFGRYLKPKSVQEYRNSEMERIITGTQHMIRPFLENILKVTPEDVKTVASMLYGSSKTTSSSVILDSKADDTTANLIKL